MIKAALAASAVVLTVVPCASAAVPMSADENEGGVSLSVKGSGLHVDKAGGFVEGQANGSKFRLYTVYKGSRHTLTRWKLATFASGGLTKMSYANWNLDRNFRAGTWLCVESNIKSGKPCAKIHR
ncbi:hypothetical protein [Streptomyces longispororuber]|uniref:hypothetical protein n=1 Tax=Streptomyces longispororuber TaxID=68230 RepID=UPI00210D237C|nr:hypothetical protein [Streptomyces longispororuber]MCQ4211350.1 hypothetical protein [Streptomyces longispororuber]